MKSNLEIAKILEEMGVMYDIDSVAYKPRAYEKAAFVVREYPIDLSEVFLAKGTEGLKKIKGIGNGVASDIKEILETGNTKVLSAFQKKFPVDIHELSKIQGLGPKNIKRLYEEAGVRTVSDLKKLIEKGKLKDLPHFGNLTEKNLKDSIEPDVEKAGRLPISEALKIAEKVRQNIIRSGNIQQLLIAGSLRRGLETIGDIDLLGVSQNPGQTIAAFCNMSGVKKVLEKGPVFAIVQLDSGVQVDLRLVPEESFGAASIYFTGDKSHNIHLRSLAIDNGWKLSEYGLYRGKHLVAGRTEEAVYKALGLEFIPPELRCDSGEIALAQEDKLPRVVSDDDIILDLHPFGDAVAHSVTYEEVTSYARKHGLHTIGLVFSVPVATQVNTKTLESEAKAFADAVKKLNADLQKRRVTLKILKISNFELSQGETFDIPKAVDKLFDLHGFSLATDMTDGTPEERTARILDVLSNGTVKLFFHPTSRDFAQKTHVAYDYESVFKACAKAKVAIEVSANQRKMDLSFELIKIATEAGAVCFLSGDIDSEEDFENLKIAAKQARRAGVEKKGLLNCLNQDKLVAWLEK